MQILNSIDAISPAFARTKLVLFTPFRAGRSWKLSATAYLSFAGTLFFPFTLMYLAPAPALNHAGAHGAAAFFIALSLILTALYCVLFLLCSRLQFAFFDIVLNRGEFVAPAWRKYGAVAWRWTLVKAVAGLVLTAAIAAPMYPLAKVLLHSMKDLGEVMKNVQPGQPPPPQMMTMMAGFYGLYFLLMLILGAYYLVMSTLSAFVVPSMALEGLGPADALRRFLVFAKREPGALAGFVGMRLVMGIAGYMGIAIAFELAALILLLIFGVICFLIGMLLHAVGVPSAVLTGLGIFAVVAFMLFLSVYGFMFALGWFFTFFEAHTLYFLGGRYPLLGELLERSTPPPAAQPAYAYPYAAPGAWPAQPPPPAAPPPPPDIDLTE